MQEDIQAVFRFAGGTFVAVEAPNGFLDLIEEGDRADRHLPSASLTFETADTSPGARLIQKAVAGHYYVELIFSSGRTLFVQFDDIGSAMGYLVHQGAAFAASVAACATADAALAPTED